MNADLKAIDATVRQNSIEMFGNDTLNARYVTALNMINVMAPGMSPGMLRLKPAAPAIPAKTRPDPIEDPSTLELDQKTEGVGR